MPLDALCLAAVVAELSPSLTGARIDKVRQPERDVLVLGIRGADGARRLLISAGASDARLHFTDEDMENPKEPPMFCMLLRKHISGAVITGVTQPPYERVVTLELSASSALGEREEKRLVLELMGRNSNIILVGADGRIIDCLRRVDVEMSETRPVLPGLIYRLPPRQDKAEPPVLLDGGSTEMLGAAPADAALEKWLVGAFMAVSPLIAREIAYRAYGDTGVTMREAIFNDGGAAIARAAADILLPPPDAVLIAEKNGRARDFSFTEIRQYEDALDVTREDGFSAMLDRFYTRGAMIARIKTRGANIERTVKNARDRAARRVSAQRTELKSAADREHLRECGDILMANLHTLTKGAAIAVLEDFYAENEGAAREIKLDPRKSPQQNAQKYYKDYAKAKNAEKFLAERIEAGEQEITYLESVLSALKLTETERELDDIRRELAGAGYVREEKRGKAKPKPSEPRSFTAPSGAEIIAGRNNAQNDALTFKTAFRTDVWLHAQKRHGAHVILRTNGQIPPENDIEEAAAVAAYYSDARGDSRVAVDWCLARYVKKIPGAKPGMVIYTDYKTVIVEPKENAGQNK